MTGYMRTRPVRLILLSAISLKFWSAPNKSRARGDNSRGAFVLCGGIRRGKGGVAVTRCIISFPRSGRTWLRMMLDQLAVPVEACHAGASTREAIHMDSLNTAALQAYDRVLLLLRDPRDTLVSGFHEASTRFKYEGTMGDFIRDPHRGIEKIVTFNLMWAAAVTGRHGAAIVAYEQMLADTAGA